MNSFGLNSVPVTVLRGLATTKDAGTTVEFQLGLAADGTIASQKIINATEANLPLNFYVQLVIPIGFEHMLTSNDTFFNKFYWKRTA